MTLFQFWFADEEHSAITVCMGKQEIRQAPIDYSGGREDYDGRDDGSVLLTYTCWMPTQCKE